MFEHLGLQSFAKTSGSKGLQVYVPLNDERVTYEQTKPFAKAVAELLEGAEPDLVVSRMTKARRAGKVLIDWSQNDAQEDDRLRLLAARARAPDRLDAARLGRGARSAATRATRPASRSTQRQVLERVASAATCSRRCCRWCRRCRTKAPNPNCRNQRAC